MKILDRMIIWVESPMRMSLERESMGLSLSYLTYQEILHRYHFVFKFCRDRIL